MSKKILTIDDELDTLTFYSEVLEDHNFTPVTAQNGEEGLKKEREEKPNLIILDIHDAEKERNENLQRIKDRSGFKRYSRNDNYRDFKRSRF